MILGIDYGARRIGVAAADPVTRFAHPVEVIDTQKQNGIDRIVELIREFGVSLVVVGRPVGLSGTLGPAVMAQQEWLGLLKAATLVEVAEYDERFTTVDAERGLRAAGVRASARRNKRDAVAAQLLLQAYLDSSR